MKEKKDAVYQINYQQCDAQYIGEISRQIGQWMNEHYKDAWKSRWLSHGYQHTRETDHAVNLNNPSILGTEVNFFPGESLKHFIQLIMIRKLIKQMIFHRLTIL